MPEQPGCPSVSGADSPTPCLWSAPPGAADAQAPEGLLAPPQGPGEVGRFGPYRVLAVLGSGGMGAVFLAEQPHPRRRVALKVSLAPPHTGRRARSRHEPELIARLQHPHIVPVYEAGEHDGRPYFTMEVMECGSLARRLAGGPLPAGEAARVVEAVARAVHYAHGQGVVHRDLKPGNVLLAADGTPKVSDFGLAKQFDAAPEVTDGRTETATGALLGTPAYMAPEQTGEGAGAGPAADVWALGAVLYECLTGRPPFKAASVLRTLEQVRSREPVPPSRLQDNVPRDLQTVCLKCLEKDPRKRYGSAGELADDLGRFLRGEPVRARPTGAWGRLWKWARRRPAAAALVAVSGLSVLALLLGLLWHSARLQREARRAEAGERAAREEHRRAAANYRQARQALEKMLGRLDDGRLAEVPRLRELREGLLEDTLAFYQGVLEGQQGADPAVRLDAAVASYQVGKIRYLLGKPDAARTDLGRARALLEGLAAEAPDDLNCRFHLAQCYVLLGAAAERPEAAQDWLRKAVALREELHRALPDDPNWAYNLAQAQNTLAAAYQRSGRRDRAEGPYTEALTIYERLHREYPDNVTYRIALAETSGNLALLRHQAGRRDAAEEGYRRARCLLEPLLAGRAAGPDFLSSVAATYLNYGNLLKETRRRGEALVLYTRAVELLEPAVGREPRHGPARDGLLKCRGARAMAHYEAGRYSESAVDWGRVIEVAAEADRPRYRYCRANTWHRAREYARAAAEVRAVADRPGFAPAELSTMACICAAYVGTLQKETALSSAERDCLAEEYGALAVALLRKAHAAGLFKDLSLALSLWSDKDLAPVRARADFRQLCAEITRKKK